MNRVLAFLVGVALSVASVRAATVGAVATVRDLATEAGMSALRDGGNAVDAAVAAGLMLGVVDGYNSGIGGGCFILIRLHDGTSVAIDGRETAPAGATRDMFVRDGEADPKLSRTGALAVGVPGALAAYAVAAERYGRLPLKRHLLAAAKVAEEGFRIDAQYRSRLSSVAGELRHFEESRRIFLDADGKALKVGQLLVQPDLGRSYRAIATEGTKWFYEGAFAEATEKWMKANGGVLKASDLGGYQVKFREVVRTSYRGHEILGFPPPSSGGTHVAQILNIIEHHDIASMGAGSADFIHVVGEAMKLAFADRAHWLGDSDFAKVPKGLIAKDYARELSGRIDLKRASKVEGHSVPPKSETSLFGKHTTHFSTADAKGNWVACTATINTTFGSKVVVPGTGVVLNNEMDDFAAQPGAPNAFGLVGTDANAVAAGKRPLSSMSPSIVLKDGQPILSVGAAGGPTIISQTVLAIIGVVDFGMDAETALNQERFHHQWLPDRLTVEESMAPSVRRELERRGHQLRTVKALGASQAVGLGKGEELKAVREPRLR